MDEQRAASYVLGPGQSRSVPDGPDGFKIRAADSGGLVSLFEFSLQPWQSGPDLHRHHDSDEAFYVVEGTMEMQVGEDRLVLGVGEFAWVPRGSAHTFANAGPGTARALTIATPGGLEHFLADLHRFLASSTGQPDRAALAELRTRHGGTLLGPPIRARAAPENPQ